MISDARSEYDDTDLAQASDAAGSKEAMVLRDRSCTELRAENIQRASIIKGTELKIEELQLTLSQKIVTTKAMTSSIVALEKRVNPFLEGE